MRDIETNEDVFHLVEQFYTKVMVDPDIGHFFNVVVKLDLKEHLPKISSFWASVLLGDSTYKGNPMTAHILLNEKSPLEGHHFQKWLSLWEETVKELYKGEKADMAVTRAKNVAGLMQFKISEEGKHSLL